MEVPSEREAEEGGEEEVAERGDDVRACERHVRRTPEGRDEVADVETDGTHQQPSGQWEPGTGCEGPQVPDEPQGSGYVEPQGDPGDSLRAHGDLEDYGNELVQRPDRSRQEPAQHAEVHEAKENRLKKVPVKRRRHPHECHRKRHHADKTEGTVHHHEAKRRCVLRGEWGGHGTALAI